MWRFFVKGLEDGEDEKEGEETNDGDDGEDNGTEVLAALDFAVDAEDAGFVFVVICEAINADGEGDNRENTNNDEDSCGFHDSIIA